MMNKRYIKLAIKNGTIETVKDDMIAKAVRNKYSISQELAILRQRDTKPDEFREYNDFVENVKTEVKAYIAECRGDSNVIE